MKSKKSSPPLKGRKTFKKEAALFGQPQLVLTQMRSTKTSNLHVTPPNIKPLSGNVICSVLLCKAHSQSFCKYIFLQHSY